MHVSRIRAPQFPRFGTFGDSNFFAHVCFSVFLGSLLLCFNHHSLSHRFSDGVLAISHWFADGCVEMTIKIWWIIRTNLTTTSGDLTNYTNPAMKKNKLKARVKFGGEGIEKNLRWKLSPKVTWSFMCIYAYIFIYPVIYKWVNVYTGLFAFSGLFYAVVICYIYLYEI